jgi:formate transporter
MDALLPAEIAERAEALGAEKTRYPFLKLMTLAVLAGAFIALGAMFSTTVMAGASDAAPFGLVRLAGGLAFALGLVLVVLGGAELFTGNNLMVMAWVAGKIGFNEMLRAWIIIYVGNAIGALGTALLVFLAEQYRLGGGGVGVLALEFAEAKAGLAPLTAFMRGVLCNVLVCLAVWLAIGARGAADRMLVLLLPVAAFVAAGFEHSVANMYMIPLGQLILAGAPDAFWQATGLSPDGFAAIGWRGLVANLIPVTAGNIVGGGILVGTVYWFVYRRNWGSPRRDAAGKAPDRRRLTWFRRS